MRLRCCVVKIEASGNGAPPFLHHPIGNGKNTVKNKILSFYLLLILAVNHATAQANEKVSKILFYPRGGHARSLNFEDLKPDVSYSFVHPHLVMDPEKKRHNYGGVDLEKLLRLKFGNVSPEDTITFISADTYVASLSFSDLTTAKALLSLQMDGKIATWKQGVPGLMFPPTSAKMAYQTDQTWWAWWVSAVVQGEPKVNLRWNEGVLDLSTCHNKHTRIVPYPRGRRTYQGWKDKKAEITYCSLQKLTLGKRIKSIENMIGKKQTISEKSMDLVLVHAVNGSPIPISMGGPYQVCKSIDAEECIYFVSKLEGEDVKTK